MIAAIQRNRCSGGDVERFRVSSHWNSHAETCGFAEYRGAPLLFSAVDDGERAAQREYRIARLRIAEAVHLKPSDTDCGRMVIRVEQGKGRKERYVCFRFDCWISFLCFSVMA